MSIPSGRSSRRISTGSAGNNTNSHSNHASSSNLSRADSSSNAATLTGANSANSNSNSSNGETNADSIKVLCRFRPPRREQRSGRELNPNQETIDNFKLDEEYNEVQFLSDITENKVFKFDRVFGTSTTQQQLFSEVQGVVDSVMAGFNGTIMAYGQTSAGKSFSMEGLSLRDDTHMGIIPRCVDRLFAEIERAHEDDQFQVILSYYEIYCEKIRDLLNPQAVNLKLRESKGSGFIIQDVTEIYCTDRESVLRVIEFGKANRAAAPTLMNAESSRSHSIVSLLVDQKNTTTGRNKKGNLFLVDLAGSEKVSKTGASGLRLEEAKNINGSLTTLGMVINALCDNQSHVPYRDSKLTMILMDALGGNSKTTLVVCCNPEHAHTPETLSTLRFGERAKRIKQHARVNEEYSVEELKQMLIAAKREIAALKASGLISVANEPENLAITNGEPSASTSTAAIATEDNATAAEKEEREKEKEKERERERARLRAKIRFLERERITHGNEKEALLEEISSLKARLSTLEEELETERMKLKDEQEQRMDIATESAALKATISELEERLLQATRLTKKSQQQLRASSSFFENNNNNTPDVKTIFSFDDVEEAPHTPDAYRDGPAPSSGDSASSLQGTPRLDEDVSMADLQEQGKHLQSHFEEQIKELTSSINEHEIEAKTAQASAENFAAKYMKLREEYELHVQRLMLKLTQEQQARATMEDKLEDAQHRLWQTTGRSGGANRSLWSWFSSAGGNQSSSAAKSLGRSTSLALDREQNNTRALELSQFRISQLVAELEANKEAQAIVLETKESVMRSLARQNSQLTLERDQLNRRVEDLIGEKERLANLVRDLQSRSREALPTQDQASLRRRVLKGGMHTKERSFVRVPIEDLQRVRSKDDEETSLSPTESEKVYPRVSFSPVNVNSNGFLSDTAEQI